MSTPAPTLVRAILPLPSEINPLYASGDVPSLPIVIRGVAPDDKVEISDEPVRDPAVILNVDKLSLPLSMVSLPVIVAAPVRETPAGLSIVRLTGLLFCIRPLPVTWAAAPLYI